ncbi:MAG: hypothetical protein ACE5H8_10615 [Alphaproteobacteria bacterium]
MLDAIAQLAHLGNAVNLIDIDVLERPDEVDRNADRPTNRFDIAVGVRRTGTGVGRRGLIIAPVCARDHKKLVDHGLVNSSAPCSEGPASHVV